MEVAAEREIIFTNKKTRRRRGGKRKRSGRGSQ